MYVDLKARENARKVANRELNEAQTKLTEEMEKSNNVDKETMQSQNETEMNLELIQLLEAQVQQCTQRVAAAEAEFRKMMDPLPPTCKDNLMNSIIQSLHYCNSCHLHYSHNHSKNNLLLCLF
jgi:hypothetical protein